jgi:PBP1b-binding outer membrane lipoprotein LpoB
MANPNIVNVSDIRGVTVQADLTTTLTTEIISAVTSNHIYKINSITVANIDGTSAADVSVFITKSGGSPIAIASTISVPADASLSLIDKNSGFYLQEGDNIEAGASADGDLTITISYEDIS